MDKKALAKEFAAKLTEYGFAAEIKKSVVTITKRIPIGDGNAFASAEMEASHLLSLAPHRGGSVWGTDGGSIGGMAAMNSGNFRMNKSGSGAIAWGREVSRLMGVAEAARVW